MNFRTTALLLSVVCFTTLPTPANAESDYRKQIAKQEAIGRYDKALKAVQKARQNLVLAPNIFDIVHAEVRLSVKTSCDAGMSAYNKALTEFTAAGFNASDLALADRRFPHHGYEGDMTMGLISCAKQAGNTDLIKTLVGADPVRTINASLSGYKVGSPSQSFVNGNDLCIADDGTRSVDVSRALNDLEISDEAERRSIETLVRFDCEVDKILRAFADNGSFSDFDADLSLGLSKKRLHYLSSMKSSFPGIATVYGKLGLSNAAPYFEASERLVDARIVKTNADIAKRNKQIESAKAWDAFADVLIGVSGAVTTTALAKSGGNITPTQLLVGQLFGTSSLSGGPSAMTQLGDIGQQPLEKVVATYLLDRMNSQPKQ